MYWFEDGYDVLNTSMWLSILVHTVSLSLLFLYNVIFGVRKRNEETADERWKQEQTIIDAEYKQAVASQNLTEPWAVRYETLACPCCGHYKVRIAKWDDKKVSVAFWGVASDKIGKEYICDNCKKMW